jgi:hypothetical protein
MSKLQKKPAAHKRGHPTLPNMNFKKFGSGFQIRIRRSLRTSKENIQHHKHRNSLLFSISVVVYALLDPDPDPATQSGSGS